ncbi:S-layer homology domain-containing protein [Bacilliculturomica massiliensis]|uniref:S-layer homology domain-containing protein n=1 Tax=Bacilliculturomica massiliensis TaxID=1917867 RepID=UPI001031EDA5|nr:S-layer homology domain-containing protein [Bacilliculturomica massiliensis]
MRKVLSFVLVLSLVLGSFGMAFAATTPSDTSLSDIDGQKCEDAVRVLANLDVVSGYEDGTYKPEQTVTRAEMASLIIKALGLKETDAVPKFADSKTHWAKGYIAYANTLGIISGRSETVFDPDATVTYDEATTMLIKALGYTDESLVGTYPASFVSRAKVLGILDGIQTGTAGANRGDVAIMLYQTLDQAIGKVDKDGNFNATVIEWKKGDGNATQVKKYDTMLDRLGAEIASSSNLKGVAAWREDIDEDAFIVSGDEDSIINLTPYKGAAVSAYVNSDGDILAIKESFSTFVSGTIKDDVLSLADGTEYTLKKDAIDDLTKTAEYFQNGDNISLAKLEKVASDDLSARNEAVNFTLAVDLSGKKINEVHSVLYWQVTNYDLLEADDLNDITKNHKLLGVDFDEDNNDDIDLDSFELVGVNSLDDIKADMAAYVYKNNDDKIARVAVGPVERISGEATKVNSKGTKVTVDGKVYKYAKEELAGNGAPGEVSRNEIEAGDDVVLTMDAYGYIYDCDAAGDSNYAVVLRIEDDTTDRVTGDAQLKLLLADGSSKIFSVDKDDITSSAITNGAWVRAKVTTGAIVKYSVDKSGVIDDLSVIVTKGDSSDVVTAKDILTGTATADITAKGYFNGKQLATDAVLFNYEDVNFGPGKAMSDKADDYSIAKYENVLDSEDVKAYYVYDTNKKKIVAMLMDNATSSNDIFGVVNSKGKNNSAAGAYYNMLIDGKEVTYNGTDSNGSESIAKYNVSTNADSELYRVKFDASGDIKQFESWNNGKDKVNRATITINSSNVNDVNMNNRTFTAPAKNINNDYYNATTAAVTKNTSPEAITIDRDAIVYVYDKADAEWQLGNVSDLRALKANTNIRFYDVIDEDGIYDIILIDESGAVGSTPSTPATSKEITVSSGAAINCTGATITVPNGASFVESVMTFSGAKLTIDTDYTLDGNFELKITLDGLKKLGIAANQSTTVTVVFDNNAKTTVKVNRIADH